MTACIVGWSHLPFGKHEGRDVESLIVEAARGAVAVAVGDAEGFELLVEPVGPWNVVAAAVGARGEVVLVAVADEGPVFVT